MATFADVVMKIMDAIGRVLCFLWFKFSHQPAMTAEVVKHTFNVLTLFGILSWTEQQLASMNIFVGLVLQVLVMQTVTPNVKVEQKAEARADEKVAAKIATGEFEKVKRD